MRITSSAWASKPTLTTWHQHMTTYGGVVLLLAIQTVVLFWILGGKNR